MKLAVIYAIGAIAFLVIAFAWDISRPFMGVDSHWFVALFGVDALIFAWRGGMEAVRTAGEAVG